MANGAEAATRTLQAPVDLWKSFRTFGFLISITLAQWYFYINAPTEGFSKDIALVYMFMGSAFLGIIIFVTSAQKVEVKELRTVRIIYTGFFGFIIAYAVTLGLYGQVLGMTFGTLPVTALFGTVLTQVLYVAVVEEMVFRWLLPTYFKTKFVRWFALLIPQAMFALFHTSVYQGDWSALFIAFLFGCVMILAFEYKPRFWLKKGEEPQKLGLGFTIGCHAAFNLLLLGALAPNGISMILGG
jgi:membrane protease YdiL (CAAX protease family)